MRATPYDAIRKKTEQKSDAAMKKAARHEREGAGERRAKRKRASPDQERGREAFSKIYTSIQRIFEIFFRNIYKMSRFKKSAKMLLSFSDDITSMLSRFRRNFSESSSFNVLLNCSAKRVVLKKKSKVSSLVKKPQEVDRTSGFKMSQ